jgi:hypothetical protein
MAAHDCNIKTRSEMRLDAFLSQQAIAIGHWLNKDGSDNEKNLIGRRREQRSFSHIQHRKFKT